MRIKFHDHSWLFRQLLKNWPLSRGFFWQLVTSFIVAVDVVERWPLSRSFNRSQCMDYPPGQKKEVVVHMSGGRCGEVVMAVRSYTFFLQYWTCTNEFLSFPEIRKVCKQVIGGIEDGGAPQAVLAGNRVKLPSVFQLRYFFTKMRLVSGVCVKLLLNILENQLHFTC